MINEQRIDGLEARVALLERHLGVAPRRDAAAAAPAARRPSAAPPVAPTDSASPSAAPRPSAARPSDLGGFIPPRRSVAPPRRAAPRPEALRLPPLRAPAVDLEELLGGRVLAWVGALAVLIGIFFLLVIAVSRGWIGEAERTVMAGLASLALLVAGVRLHERRGRTEASLAAAATGIAGLFGSLAVAGAVYDLVPDVLTVLGALAVGAAATALALRWEAHGIGALGIIGALLSPVLVGADPTGESVALLAVALASATAVLLWQRWNWLAFAAFAITTPQWLAWLGSGEPSAVAIVAVLALFGALNAAAAVGFEVRSRAPGLRISSAVLLTLNALVLAAAGWLALPVAAWWLAALAAAHAVVGLAGARTERVSHELSLLALTLAVVLADVAFASLASGLPLVLGWVAAGGAFAALAGKGLTRHGDQPFAAAGLGGHLLLALGHALVLDAPRDVVGSAAGADALVAVAAVAAGCAVSARLAEEAHPAWRMVLDAAGLAVFAYLTATALDGASLTLGLAGEAVALALLARRSGDAVALGGAGAYAALAAGHLLAATMPADAIDAGAPVMAMLAAAAVAVAFGAAGRAAAGVVMTIGPTAEVELRMLLDAAALVAVAYLTAVVLDGAALTAAFAAEAVVLALVARRAQDELTAHAAGAFLVLALGHGIAVLAPPGSLVAGADAPPAAAAGLGAVVAAALVLARLAPAPVRACLIGGAAVLALYVASVELVTPFQPGGEYSGLALGELGVRQQGQALLSALWAIAGVGGLVAGLVRDLPAVRRGALALLGVAVAKVFVFDLASLTSIYRVASFIVLGLVLLCGAFAWQRVRPRPLPDLRGMPKGLR